MIARAISVNQIPQTKTTRAKRYVLKIFPGAVLALGLAAISIFIEQSYGGPVMLYALIVGVLFNRAAGHHYFQPGITFSAKTILKIGVALLAVKITIIDVVDLGWQTALFVVAGVSMTLTIGTVLGRALGLTKDHAVLSAGSVAICGSSAALAIASVLPRNERLDCNTIVTVIAVTTLSTVAMVLYPLIASVLNFSDTQAGLFIGATIHNVAQVVGAGYIVSDPAGEIAVIVKLMRVACLVPAIIIISLMFRQKTQAVEGVKTPPPLPLFMVAFIVIMMINSLGFIPVNVGEGFSELSRWALVTAVAALGVKTSVKDIIGVGIRPLLALVFQTILLAMFALFVISFILAF